MTNENTTETLKVVCWQQGVNSRVARKRLKDVFAKLDTNRQELPLLKSGVNILADNMQALSPNAVSNQTAIQLNCQQIRIQRAARASSGNHQKNIYF